jgi:hypothetical protein
MFTPRFRRLVRKRVARVLRVTPPIRQALVSAQPAGMFDRFELLVDIVSLNRLDEF